MKRMAQRAWRIAFSIAWWYLLFGPAVPLRPASGPMTFVQAWQCGEWGCTQREWRPVQLAGPFEDMSVCDSVRTAEVDTGGFKGYGVSQCVYLTEQALPNGSPQLYFRDGTPVVIPAPRVP